MNLAQVEAYLADDVQAHSLSAWASREVDPRKWEPLSKLQRMFPVEYKAIMAEKPRGRRRPVTIKGVTYKSIQAAADAQGVDRDTIRRWAGRKKSVR